ncbi:MAG: ABC transporter ATP-binding protein [Nitrospirae bacterium]|nr:ABC transporter ATP-binding protein [Candidatus Troglogloeales bacterium]
MHFQGESWRFLFRVLTYIKPYKELASYTLFAAGSATVLELVPPWLIKRAIDEGVGKKQPQLLLTLVLGMVGIYVGKGVLNMVRIRLNNALEQNVIFDIRNQVFQAVQRLSLSYFDDRSTGEIMSRVNSDVENMERIFIDGMENLLIAGVTLLGVTTMLFVLEWRLALVALVPIPFLIYSAIFFTTHIHPRYKTVRHELAQLNAFLQDRLSGIRETMIFNRQQYEGTRFEERNRAVCEGSLSVARLWSLYSPSMTMLASFGTVAVLGVGSYLAALGSLTVGELVAFLAYAAIFYAPINQIHAINHMLQHALVAAERVFELLDTGPTVLEPKDPVIIPERLTGAIGFHQVSFHYLENQPVLEKLDFNIVPGETVALVGATGSGKSTTISLLMRFYDAKEGMITLDGYDVRKMSIQSLRDQFSLVRQEPFLFNGTVRENIAYGKPHATFAEIEHATQAACANDFIEQLPNRYETHIGERGVKLSIGQKQRVAIARAFLKDPPIIVFDEGTSNIDSETEEGIQEGLQNLFANRTTLIIAHRLSSLRKADRILVIEKGKIVESGKHEMLISKKGVYAKLFEAQMI